MVVSPSATFEGAMIAEIAQVFPYPSVYVLRGSQFLTDDDWSGPERPRYRTVAETGDALARSRARVLVVHDIAGVSTQASGLVDALAARQPAGWSLIFDRSLRTDRGTERLRAWDLNTPPGPPDLGPVVSRLWEKRLKPAIRP